MTARRILYLTAWAIALYGFPASAATVIPYSGDVFVSQGNGFQKIGGATVVKAGDSVMVSPNGLAQVQLDDGNAITVSPGQVLSVPAKARAKDSALPDGASPTQANSGADNGVNDLIVGGVLVAGAAVGAALLFNSNNGGAPVLVPASP
jgi:hypothetical protein